MLKIVRKYLGIGSLMSVTPIAIGFTTLDYIPSVNASETDRTLPTTTIPPVYPSPKQGGLSQLTSVSQLSDVQPTDWAFQALQSLIERYGCIEGYPDRTFRGNRAITRHEFAAGLNACLNRIQQLITTATPANSQQNQVTQNDLATIQRLQTDFRNELKGLSTRIDSLQTRSTQLETQQFSPTTKLQGTLDLFLRDSFATDNITDLSNNTRIDANANTLLQYRVRLNLISSFTGKDRLRTRLQAANVQSLLNETPIAAIDNNSTRSEIPVTSGEGLSDDDEEDLLDIQNPIQQQRDPVTLHLLDYNFPVNQNLKFHIFATGGRHSLYVDRITPSLTNPIYNLASSGGNFGAGIGINYKLNHLFKLDLGYITGQPSSPLNSQGLFNGSYSALSQLVIQPHQNFQLGLIYINGYSANPNRPLRFGSSGTYLGNLLTSEKLSSRQQSNTFGIAGSYRVSPNFNVAFWGSYTNVDLLLFEDANAEIWNYGLIFSLPDLGKKGSEAILIVGVDSTLTGLSIGDRPDLAIPQRDLALFVDASYKYQLTDNIAITPSIQWRPSLSQDFDNDDVIYTTVKTTFTF